MKLCRVFLFGKIFSASALRASRLAPTGAEGECVAFCFFVCEIHNLDTYFVPDETQCRGGPARPQNVCEENSFMLNIPFTKMNHLFKVFSQIKDISL